MSSEAPEPARARGGVLQCFLARSSFLRFRSASARRSRYGSDKPNAAREATELSPPSQMRPGAKRVRRRASPS